MLKDFLKNLSEKDEKRKKLKEIKHKLDLLSVREEKFKEIKERLYEYFLKLKQKDENSVVYLYSEQSPRCGYTIPLPIDYLFDILEYSEGTCKMILGNIDIEKNKLKRKLSDGNEKC